MQTRRGDLHAVWRGEKIVCSMGEWDVRKHVPPLRRKWIERLLDAVENVEALAAANASTAPPGSRRGPAGGPIRQNRGELDSPRPKREKTFRVGKVILQREIPKERIQKLITTGKTDLLPKFISKKGRPFSAHLKLEKGKVGFEFAERTPKTKKAPAKKAAATSQT